MVPAQVLDSLALWVGQCLFGSLNGTAWRVDGVEGAHEFGSRASPSKKQNRAGRSRARRGAVLPRV